MIFRLTETNRFITNIKLTVYLILRIQDPNYGNVIYSAVIYNAARSLISNSQVIAEEYNNFFVSIGPQLASNIYSSTNHMSYMNTVVNSIFIPDITTIEMINVILLLKNSYAGWDDIPAYVMKR